MDKAQTWNPSDEAVYWLNEVEKMQGGANGLTIKLRAAIAALGEPVSAALEQFDEPNQTGSVYSAVCTYPDCRCPFDAPSDPNWCARGLPHMMAHNTKMTGA